jgi:hypothetical protein
VEKSWAKKSWANSLGGKSLDEKHSDRHERPIPLRTSPHGIGTITIRFVGLLVVAVVILALAWSR